MIQVNHEWSRLPVTVASERAAGVRLPHSERIEQAVEVLELAPGEFAFRQGECAPAVHAVRSGLLKQYYTDTDGNSWIKSFTLEGSAFACVEALEMGAPVSFSSQAIEHSVVERVAYSSIEKLASEFIEWQKARAMAYTILARIKVRHERPAHA